MIAVPLSLKPALVEVPLPPAPKHRDAIVEAALRLFRRNGYAASGMNDIVEASGAPKGSVYHYFPDGKAAIAVAAIELAGRRAVTTLTDLAAQSATAGALLEAYAARLGGWLARSGYRDGCPITTVVLELAPKDRAVTAAARDAFAARRRILAERLIDDGWSESEAKEFASLSVSAIQGALVQSRLERSVEPLTQVAHNLAEIVKRDGVS